MLHKKLRAFQYAYKGIAVAWKDEFHFRVDVFVSAILIIASLFFQITAMEWVIVILVCGAQLSVEIINTALEELCDIHTLEHNPQIAKIKDLGAAAALITGIAAFIVGVIIFYPYVHTLLYGYDFLA